MAQPLKAVLAVARERISGGYSAGRNMGGEQSTSLGKDPGVDYAPKAGDERKFVAAHKHIEQEYPTGMKGVFTGEPVKYSMDDVKMAHYGYKNPEDQAAAFTVQKEDIDKVASKSQALDRPKAERDGDWYKNSRNEWIKKPKTTKEEVEQIDELWKAYEEVEVDGEQLDEISRKLTGSYIKKAGADSYKAYKKTGTWKNKTSEKRQRGIHRALDKETGDAKVPTREEVEEMAYIEELWKASQNEKGEHILKHKSGKVSSKTYASKDEAISAAVRKNKVSGAFKESFNRRWVDEDCQVTDVKTNTKPTGPAKGPTAPGPVQPGTPVKSPNANDAEKNKAIKVGNHAVKEEAEQIDEISINKLKDYHKKSKAETDNMKKSHTAIKNVKKYLKRSDGQDRAQRLAGKKVLSQEELELPDDFTEELLEAGILCDKTSLKKKMKYHKGKIKNEEIGSVKYRHHLNQSNIIKKMMEGVEAVELDEKKADDGFEYKKDKRGFIVKKRHYKKKEDDKKKAVKEDIDPIVARIASHIDKEQF